MRRFAEQRERRRASKGLIESDVGSPSPEKARPALSSSLSYVKDGSLDGDGGRARERSKSQERRASIASGESVDMGYLDPEISGLQKGENRWPIDGRAVMQ